MERNNNERGLDNPAATEDDGSSIRPNLVINVQPHAHGPGFDLQPAMLFPKKQFRRCALRRAHYETTSIIHERYALARNVEHKDESLVLYNLWFCSIRLAIWETPPRLYSRGGVSYLAWAPRARPAGSWVHNEHLCDEHRCLWLSLGCGVRADMPVATPGWQSTPRGQFIPRHGLDFLIGATSLLIQQTVELNDLTSKIDSENRYIVKVPKGETLYIASEVSTQTQRCLCGLGRAFLMHLHDSTRQEAMVLTRRLAGASCLFPCRLQEMKVVTPPGDYIGRVQQQWTWVVPLYLVRDATDVVVFLIEGPAVIKRSVLQQSEFKILSGDSLREVGKIAHGWDRELVNFTTSISFPDVAVQPKHKALILAAGFLLEYTYFERAKKSSCFCC